MPRTVFIVDDDLDTNKLLADLVRNRGDHPVQIYQGGEVFDAVDQHAPELILLDLMLPDLDGYELCARLKRRRATNLIPIIMITAIHQEESRVRGVRVGANEYLTKPFTTEIFYEAVERALAWRETHMNQGTDGEICFNIRSETTYLAEVNDMLTDLYTNTPLTERQIKDLKQAVMEMGSNAIEWGHKKNADLTLQIMYRIDPGSVRLVIRDQGPGFDPRDIPHAAQPDDPIAHLDVRNNLGIREGGFGIMLARGLVDHFQYNDKGNEVTLVKYFEASDTAASANTEAD